MFDRTAPMLELAPAPPRLSAVPAIPTIPTCSSHPGSLVRRYRTHGPNGPGVYPQCVPGGGEQPHMLSWGNAPAPVALARPSATLAEFPALTLTELGVLHDAANGLTAHETAASRSKSSETVKSQRRSILLKLGARNMAHAVGIMTSDEVLALADAA